MSGRCHITPLDGGAAGFTSEPVATPAFAIGTIEVVVGSCTLTRAAQDPVQIKLGDAVYRGDIIETAAGGKVCIRFIDGTVVDLSDSARMALKEFADGATAPSALFDISNGTFNFIAGETAKPGVDIATPFGRIRGRPRTSGIGMLSLASLFFAAMDQVHAGPSDTAFLDDGNIRFKDLSSDYGVVTLTTADGRTITLDDPGETIVLRKVGSSISESHVTNSLATMLSYQNDQASALRIFAMGPSGPAGNGSNGSSTLFVEPTSATPINFTPPSNNFVPQNSLGGLNGPGTHQDVFVPFILQPPPPPPPAITISPTITTEAGVIATIGSGGATRDNTPTLMGTVSDPNGLSSVTVHIFEGSTNLGAATIDPATGAWSFSFTPINALPDGTHSFTASATDAAAGITVNTSAVTVTIDTTPPTVTISTDDSALKIGNVAHLIFTLSEPTNFGVGDIVVTGGGTLSNFQVVDATHYTANVTPPLGSTTPVTVSVASGTFADVVGNNNTTATQLMMTVDTVSTATWSITGSSSVTEGNAAGYTVHLAGTLQAEQTATIHLAIVDISTTSADYASFTAAVQAAIGSRTDLSFDPNTGTLTYTADGTKPMADLVINLGTVSDTSIEGSEQFKVVLNNPGTTTVSSITLDAANSVTTTILDSNTETFSLTQASQTVTEGAADTYTVHLSNPIGSGVTVSVNIGIILPGDPGGADAADFTHAFLADVQTAVNATPGVHLSGSTLTFDSTFTGNNFSFSLPTALSNNVEGSENYTVALSAPTTSATGAAVALDPAQTSVTTTILDPNTQTFSLTQASPTVTAGAADTYTVHLSNPISSGVTVSVNIGINLPGDPGGADAADFTHAFLADVQTAVNATPGVHLSGSTLTFDSTFTGSNFSFSLPTALSNNVEGSENYTVALSAPTTSATGAAVAIGGTGSVVTTILDNDTATWSLSGPSSVTQGSAAIYTVELNGTLEAGETATVHLAVKEISTDGDDLANFAAAVTAAIGARTDLAFNPNTGTLTYTGTGSPMTNLVISLATLAENEVEGPEQFQVVFDTPSSTTGASVAGIGSVTTTINQNHPPVVDLNGPNSAGNNNTVSATTPQTLIAPSATIVDPESQNLVSMTITLQNPQDNSSGGAGSGINIKENLSFTQDALNIINADHLQLTPVTPTQLNDPVGWIIQGSASVNDYKAILEGVQYFNTPTGSHGTLDRIVTVAVNDGTLSSATQTVTIHVPKFFPAGVAGDPINLALGDPSADHTGPISLTIAGMPEGWSLNEGSINSDGTWTVQANDIGALSIVSPANYTGSLVLNVAESWTNADGTIGSVTVPDNVEVFARGAPIFAWSGDDTLTGAGANGLFVFAQPIGKDAIYNFNTASDKIDLVGFNNITSFSDIQSNLTDDASGNAVITVGSGESITLHGVDAAALTANNFVFNLTPTTDNAGTMTIGDGAMLPLSGIINNTGTIALDSAGSTTTLELIQNGITLQGGGQLVLSDSDTNFVAGAFHGVTLTNVDNTVSGAGQLGDGQTILVNEGSIVATGTHPLVIETGSNAVINSGTLEATGSGGLIVNSEVSNSGLIWADGGNIALNGAVSGTGSALISGAAILEFAEASSVNVTFAGDNFGRLVLDHPAAYTGQVFGFTSIGSQSSDLIDLKGLTFDAGTSWSYSDNSGSNTGGTLSIYETINGATTAVESVTFGNGDYTTANFVLTSDGTGGTLIAHPPATPVSAGSATADALIGGSANDILIGGDGHTMTGGAGNDTFVFKAVTDSQPGLGHFDTITDFSHNSDHIDLSSIVGASHVQGQVAEANTVAANSISWYVDNAHNETVLYVNTGTTANHVDMEIHLTGTNINLAGSDILHHA